MKIPSLQQIVQDVKEICLRFPLVVLDAMIGTVAAVMLIEREGSSEPTILLPVLLMALLGFPLLLAMALIAEKRQWPRALQLAAQIGCIILLLIYGLSLPFPLDGAPAMHIVRYLLIMAAAIAFLMVAPFGLDRAQNGFWHFHKHLLTRIVTTVFYAAVLQLGLSLALAALEELFGLEIPGRRYGELWALIAGLFATSFFLAGVPARREALESEREYPRGLKIFAQHILSTVVLVYLIILYAYIIKIVVAWSWPQGWVSGLIIGFAAAGLAALLLLWPIREQAENRWGRLVWRWFFIVLLPPAIMLFLAVWRRISEYGFTESRYLGLAVALYLVILVLYFTFSKIKNIKMIPALLGLLALLAAFGPWSFLSVSEKSQVKRLQGLLSENAILADGKINKASQALSPEAAVQISSIVSYLHEMHGYDRIQSWFADKLVQQTEGKMVPLKPAEVTGMLGIEYMHGVRGRMDEQRSLSAKREGGMNIAGYEFLLDRRFMEKSGEKIALGASGWSCSLDGTMNHLTIVPDQASKAAQGLTIDLQPTVAGLFAEYGSTNPEHIPLEKTALLAENSQIKVKLYLRHVRIKLDGEEIKPLAYTMDILYAAKQETPGYQE